TAVDRGLLGAAGQCVRETGGREAEIASSSLSLNTADSPRQYPRPSSYVAGVSEDVPTHETLSVRARGRNPRSIVSAGSSKSLNSTGRLCSKRYCGERPYNSLL